LDRIHGAYLIEGPPGTGKRGVAAWLAALLLRGEDAEPAQDPETGLPTFPAHPDLRVVEPDGAFIKVDQIRSLQRELSLVANEGGRRVGVLLHADRLRDEAANALLKTLEEPPEAATLVLVAERSEALPLTVRSRTTRLRCAPRPEPEIGRALEEEGTPREVADLAAALGGGSLAAARHWAAEHGEAAAEIRAFLAGVSSMEASELLDFAEAFRGAGERVREVAERFLGVFGAVMRESVETAARDGDRAAARRWLDCLESAERAQREWRRRNLNAQLVVEGLLMELRRAAG
jgi:DNA polymerase-3 subunit delta'